MIVFDNRSQGLSTDTDVPAPVTIQSMAASTVDLIKALGLGKPDVWGTSLGGAVVLAMLTNHAGTVRRAVSLAGFPGGNTTQQVRLVRAHPWSPGFDYMQKGVIAHIWAKLMYSFLTGICKIKRLINHTWVIGLPV